jgi:hypothetical protein
MQQRAASMGNYSWISLLSKGNLLHPCEELVSAAKIMEKEFFKMHGSGLCKKPLVFRRWKEQTVTCLGNSTGPDEVLLCLARCRTWFRVRNLNEQMKSHVVYHKKADKKMSKSRRRKLYECDKLFKKCIYN